MNAAAPTNNAPRFDARWLMEVLALAALYFLTARLGLLLAIPGGHVTPVWPPSGIALAAVLLRRRRVWPGIWLGSFAANIWDFFGSPMSLATELGVSATLGIGASLAAVWGGHLLRRFVGGRNPLERVRDVCAFMALGGVVSCLVSATLGVSALCLTGFAPWSGYGQTWLTWWLGDTGGVFVVAPLLLVRSRIRLPQSAARWVELCGCFGLLVAVTYYVFIENTTVLFTGKPFTFILIPFLVWPAIRFGERGAATAAGLIALLAVWGTIHQTGPFNVGPRNEALLLLEIFLSVVVLTALCMAAMVTEREHAEAAQQRAVEELESRVQERTAALVQTNELLKAEIVERERARAALLSILEDQQQAEAGLRVSEERYRTLFETAPNGVAVFDTQMNVVMANRRAVEMYGYDSAEEMIGLSAYDMVVPQNWPRARENARRIMEAGGFEQVESTGVKKDGTQFAVESSAALVRDSQGKPVAILGVSRNITERKQAEAEITELLTREQAARQEAEVMRDANVGLTQNLSIETVLDTLLAHLGKLIPHDSANVMLRESETKLVVRELYGYERFQDVALTRAITLDVNENALLRQICTTGKSLLIADTDEEPAWQKQPGAEHVRCWLGVPLIAYGKVIGLYSVDKAEPGVFTPEHVRMAETLAAQAASAIQNAQLFEQGQRYAAELEQRIAERERAEEGLRISHEQLRALSARLQTAREEEGTRIARAIHDELGGALTGLKWDLEGIDKVLSGAGNGGRIETLREKIPNMTGLIESTINTVRRISSELRPGVLDDLGLVAAIEWQAQQFQARTGIVCYCDCSLEKIELSEEQSTAVFRILQETLTNVLRHAQATKVDIKINKENGYFALSISDNGKGITENEKSEQQSLGILGMRERAHLMGGEIDIKGVKGNGTVVIVRVPMSGQDRVLKMAR